MKTRFCSTARPKSLAAMIAVTGALFGVTQSHAATVVWDFTNLTDQAIGTSQNYTSGGQTITAYGFIIPSTATNLYQKQQGAGEQGIGIAAQGDHEIDKNQFIQIGVTNINLGNTISFQFGSTTTGTNPGSSTTVNEGWQIYGSNTLGTLGALITGWSCTFTGSNNCETDTTFTIGSNIFKYYGVTSTGGDVLLAKFDAAVNPVPLPGALPLFASGLAGLGLLRWRRKRKGAVTASA